MLKKIVRITQRPGQAGRAEASRHEEDRGVCGEVSSMFVVMWDGWMMWRCCCVVSCYSLWDTCLKPTEELVFTLLVPRAPKILN